MREARGSSSATATTRLSTRNACWALPSAQGWWHRAEIDQYNDAPPEGWPFWCERQIGPQISC